MLAFKQKLQYHACCNVVPFYEHGLHHWVYAAPKHVRNTIMGSTKRAISVGCNSFTCTILHLLSVGHVFVPELTPSSFELIYFGPEGKRGIVPECKNARV